MEPTCTRCDRATWIIWAAKPWCRQHFHEAQDDAAAASAAHRTTGS